jgi:DNA-binding SARP family transcriptional activator
MTRDALAEHLWPGEAGTGGRLSTVLSTLRSVLDPERRYPSDRYLVADRASIRLNRSTVAVDADEFRAAALSALNLVRGHEADRAIAGLERAAAGYTGDYLEGDDAPWASETRTELRALADQVRRELARLLLDGDSPDAAIPWLVSLVADDPYDEASHRTLVAALSRSGRHGEARRRYALYAARMAELGAEPAALADLRT